jgi:hypothetical protein
MMKVTLEPQPDDWLVVERVVLKTRADFDVFALRVKLAAGLLWGKPGHYRPGFTFTPTPQAQDKSGDAKGDDDGDPAYRPARRV